MAYQLIAVYPNQPVGTVGLAYYSLAFKILYDGQLPAGIIQRTGSPTWLRLATGTGGSYYFYGTPTARGTFTISVKVVGTIDGAVLLDIGTFTIVVVSGHLFRKSTGHLARKSSNGHLITGIGSSSTPSITTDALPNVVYGQAYNVLLAASGGSMPYTWSVVSGSFPAGLSLSSSGIISGSSTAAPATYTVTIRCADTAGQSGTRTFVFSMMANTSNVVFTIETDAYNGNINMLFVYDPAGYGYCAADAASSGDYPINLFPYPGSSMPLTGGSVFYHQYPNNPISGNGGYATTYRVETPYDYSVKWQSGASPAGTFKFWVERTIGATPSPLAFRYRIYVGGALFWERTGAGTAVYSNSRRYTQLWTFNTSTGLVS